VSAYVGGNFNNGLKAGLFYWNLNNGSSNANWNYGARHLINKIKINKRLSISFSLALAKNATD
jgi:hypothetical protein